MAGNPVVFWELASHDQERSAQFFCEVFGWDTAFDKRLGFYRVNAPGGDDPARGYIFTLRDAKLPFLTVYIQVDDIRQMRDKVEAHGGFIVIEPNEISPGTLICLFNEPSGVTFAMIQQRESPGS